MKAITADRIRKATEVVRLYCDRRRILQFKEIDALLGYPEGTSAHLFRFAREKGILAARDDLPIPVVPDAAWPLRDHFAPANVLVVETPEAAAPTRDRDDVLHEKLGWAGALHLAPRIRHRDLIAVGAGRGVFQTARHLGLVPGPHARTRHAMVVGLHGQAERRIWQATYRRVLPAINAVNVTEIMAGALPGALAFPVNLPLIQQGLEALREVFEGPAAFLHWRQWDHRPPAFAIIGVGVMGWPQELGSPDSSMAARAPGVSRMIRYELFELQKICRTFFEAHGYVPISDVCERLFWVPERDEAPDLERRAMPLIARINTHLLTVDTGRLPGAPRLEPDSPRPGSLDQVQEVMVVAGGPSKVRALHRLLRFRRDDGRRFMDTLVTDERTARALLAIEEARRSVH